MKFIFILLSFLNLPLLAASSAQSYDELVRVPQPIEQVARKHYPRVRSLYPTIAMYIEDLKKWNDHVDDFDRIPAGTQLFTVYPHPPFVANSLYKEPLYQGYNRGRRNFYSLELGLGFFQRQLTQIDDDGLIDLESTQDSPVAFNGSFFISPSERDFHYELELGVTYLMPTETTQEEDLPSALEYSAALGLLYDLPQIRNFQIKVGPSYKRLVAFNLEEILVGEPVEMREYDIAYLSLGAHWGFHVFGLFNKIKAKYSRSIWNANPGSSDEAVNSHVLFFENSIQRDKLRYGLFFERENNVLSGLDSQLTRVGFNIHYTLF